MIVENSHVRSPTRSPIRSQIVFMALFVRLAPAMVLAIVLAMVLAVAPATAQAQKTVEIEVPADPTRPPTANPPAIEVSPGEELEFSKKGGGNIFVIFTNEGKTPFVDRDGKPVYTIRVVHLGRKYRIREDENPCAQTQPGQSDCKYMVVDLKDAYRPPLDPYIIIRL